MQFVSEYSNTLSTEFCKKIISEFESRDYVYRNRPEYKFKELTLFEDPQLNELQMPLIKVMQSKMQQYVEEHNITTFPVEYGFEGIRVKRYDAGDEFPFHVDVRDYDSAKRFLVGMFYLNSNFEGGCTQFGHLGGRTIFPEEGKLVIFPPLWTHKHRGCVVHAGSKYIANVYLHYL